LIRRLYLKELLSFQSVELEFDKGLVVLSGPSGAGKSVLMSSILSSLGIGSSEAKVCEVEIAKPSGLFMDAYEIDDEIIIRSVRKDRVRHYLNDQNISKKSLNSLFSEYVNYLSVRDRGGFESETLLELIDRPLINKDKIFLKLFNEYSRRYSIYKNKLAELDMMLENEKKLSQLIEFTTFEIDKINNINPKDGEDDELILVKKQLSKIDKINEALSKAEDIFRFESSVDDIYSILGKDSSYFSDAMNLLRADFEEAEQLTRELLDTDVEALLDRLEKISELKNRYGSISEALIYKEKKEKELAGYRSIKEDKSVLELFLDLEHRELSDMAKDITKTRVEQSKKMAKDIETYLNKLKLPAISFVFDSVVLGASGADLVDLHMLGSKTGTLSGGEHNRLRLSLMAVSLSSNKKDDGIIVLDEIDANVSGDESIAISEMIAKLSESYQIFAISHQPHLASKANQHILVDKKNAISFVKVLDKDRRIQEISRIIGGESSNKEAIAFAQRLLDSKK